MKGILITLFAFIAINLQSQSQVIQKKTDSTWCIVTISQGPNGAYSLQYSQEADSLKTVEAYLRIMADKKYIIDSNLLQKEYAIYDAHLRKVTGLDFNQHQTSKIISAISGNWNISVGADTMDIKISPLLKVTGGNIKGTVEILDGNTIKLNQVVSDKGKLDPVVLRGERGKIVGKTASGQAVTMWRG